MFRSLSESVTHQGRIIRALRDLRVAVKITTRKGPILPQGNEAPKFESTDPRLTQIPSLSARTPFGYKSARGDDPRPRSQCDVRNRFFQKVIKIGNGKSLGADRRPLHSDFTTVKAFRYETGVGLGDIRSNSKRTEELVQSRGPESRSKVPSNLDIVRTAGKRLQDARFPPIPPDRKISRREPTPPF